MSNKKQNMGASLPYHVCVNELHCDKAASSTGDQRMEGTASVNTKANVATHGELQMGEEGVRDVR